MLVIDDLKVSYGQAKALQGASLKVNAGEIVAVIGRNGAGKTTLLRAVSGLVRPSSGSIKFHGREIAGLDPDAVKRMGISHVPQGRMIFADQTVEDNLLLGAYIIFGKDKSRVMANLEREYARFPRLAERRKQLAGTLSGGEQQMLAISRGLMTDPPLIALDEPSLGLAPIIVEQILKNILDLKRQGTTVLLVEQMAQAALQVADHGYLLHTGQVKAYGTGEELLGSQEVMRRYLGEAV